MITEFARRLWLVIFSLVMVFTLLGGMLMQIFVKSLDRSAPDYPQITFDKYSVESYKKSIASGKTTVVVVRSGLSIWSTKLLDSPDVRKRFHEGTLSVFDLVWSWDSDPAIAKPFFDRFGFSKEAFVVITDKSGVESVWHPVRDLQRHHPLPLGK